MEKQFNWSTATKEEKKEHEREIRELHNKTLADAKDGWESVTVSFEGGKTNAGFKFYTTSPPQIEAVEKICEIIKKDFC